MKGIYLFSVLHYHQRTSVHNKGANTIIAVQNCPDAHMKKIKIRGKKYAVGLKNTYGPHSGDKKKRVFCQRGPDEFMFLAFGNIDFPWVCQENPGRVECHSEEMVEE